MHTGLKILQLIFNEQGLIFLVQRKETNEYFYCSVDELFRNDSLLTEFSNTDVRLISYFAAVDEHQLDRLFLQKTRSSVMETRKTYISSGIRR